MLGAPPESAVTRGPFYRQIYAVFRERALVGFMRHDQVLIDDGVIGMVQITHGIKEPRDAARLLRGLR